MPTLEDDRVARKAGQHDDLGVSDYQRQAEVDSLNDSFYRDDDSDISQKENSPGSGISSTYGDRAEASSLSGLYNDQDKPGGLIKGVTAKIKSLSGKNKTALIFGAGGGGASVFAIAYMFMGMLGPLNLDMFLKNIEGKSFVRFQIDIENRSSKWVNAYVSMRLMEVDSNDAPGDRDNMLFRANRVDNNNPLTDWYKTLRASKFEQEVFEKSGIKFSSAVYRDGDRLRVRPAIVTINDNPIRMDLLTQGDLDALMDAENGKFDVNKFNGELRNAVDVEILNSDKEGRKAVKRIVKENTKPWQFAKRYYTRKAIQNQIGIRDWRFFEKTREGWRDKRITFRNKMIEKSLPESTKSGKLARCLFGIDNASCSRSTDPNNPSNHSDLERSSSTPVGDDGDNDTNRSTTSKLISGIVKSANIIGGLDLLNQLTELDGKVKDGSLSKTVYAMRNAQAIAAFTTLGVAASQAHTGEINDEELNEFMHVLSYAGTSEGWNKVVIQGPTRATVSAAAYMPAKDREEYCSDEHQESMKLPENRKIAEREFHYLCDSQKVGASLNAQKFESAWENSIGYLLGPLDKALDSTGLGWLLDKFNEAVGAILGPVMNGILKGLGLDDNINSLIEWAVGKVSTWAGAVPLMDESSPGGVILNHMIQGAAGSAEASSRLAGASLSTNQSVFDSNQRIAQYLENKKTEQSVFDKYLSLENTDSLLASSITKIATTRPDYHFSDSFSLLWKLPTGIFTSKGSAQKTTGREAANFGEIKMYDMPRECIDREPLSILQQKPADQTNADEIGLLTPEEAQELTWETVSDSGKFYGMLYEKHPDSSDAIENVYNCAVFDDMARGATAGKHEPSLAGSNAISEDTSVNTAESSGLGGDLRIATFNILYSTSGKGVWQDRLRKSINVITSNGLQVAGLQEVRPVQYNELKSSIGDEYGFCPGSYSEFPDHASQNLIIWLKSDVDMIECKAIEGYQVLGPKSLSNVQVKLRLKSTGQEFYVINHHEPVGNAERILARYNSAKERAAYVKNLSGEGLPIFLTGDFNSKMLYESNQRTYGNDKNNSAYCIFTDNLLWHAYDAERNKTGKCPSWGTTGVGVDHIFMSTSVSVNKFEYKNITPSQNGSDSHNTVYADVSFAGSSNQPAGNFSGKLSWPIAKSDWPSGGVYDCDLKYNDGTVHTGIDISIPSGTRLYAATSGLVSRPSESFGMMNIEFEIDGKKYYVNYQHMSSIKFKDGDRVNEGDFIGLSGSKGTASPHLHFSLWKVPMLSGHRSINSSVGKQTYSQMLHPLNYLEDDGRNISCGKAPYSVPN